MTDLSCCGNCINRAGTKCEKRPIVFDNAVFYRGLCEMWEWDMHKAEDRTYFLSVNPKM